MKYILIFCICECIAFALQINIAQGQEFTSPILPYDTSNEGKNISLFKDVLLIKKGAK